MKLARIRLSLEPQDSVKHRESSREIKPELRSHKMLFRILRV